MKAKAIILAALLLAPATATAGAQVVNAVPAPAVVKVTEADLPVALSDEELDDVKGEVLVLAPAAPYIAAAASAAAQTVVRVVVAGAIGTVLTSDSAQQKSLTNSDIKKLKDNDIDPHELKQSGSGGRVSDKDLYKDRDGNVYVKPKGGKGPGEPTGVNLKDLP